MILNMWVEAPLGVLNDPFTGVAKDHGKTQIFVLRFIAVVKLQV